MEQQLRRDIEQLRKDNVKLSRDIAKKSKKWFLKSDLQLSHSDDRGHLGGGKDSEMTMVELQSEKTYWEEQCKCLKKDFEVRTVYCSYNTCIFDVPYMNWNVYIGEWREGLRD